MTKPNPKLLELTNAFWDSEILPVLDEFIRIPNQSPLFDPQWREHGHMARAVGLALNWARAQGIAGATWALHELPGRTPLISLEAPGTLPDAPTVLLYGHLDKQPPFEGWRTSEGLGPWVPVRQGDKLYGRGGADDGYALFAATSALLALEQLGANRPRIVGIFECSEESGSPDLPAYVEHLSSLIAEPSLVVCLDSGCGDYERLWWTTSLRGMVTGELRVRVLTEGIHSGQGTGIGASTLRIARALLDRLEDSATGHIRLPALHAEIPSNRVEQAHAAAKVLGAGVIEAIPFAEGVEPVTQDPAELLLNRTWRPTLEVTGARGLPPLESAGNVLRPTTELKLSFRLPPTTDAFAAQRALKAELERNSPYGAQVEFASEKAGSGWQAPAEAPWLLNAVEESSKAFFGAEPCAQGEGGSIPFMGMLGERFPRAQFLVTGVLGPHANAHGPNEFLHIPTAKKLTACVAHLLSEAAIKQ
jgi:acetylornithine deacetylase/succinyl-diaminopimelate desuccinylase-like protein